MKLSELANHLQLSFSGDGSIDIKQISSIKNPKDGSVILLLKKKDIANINFNGSFTVLTSTEIASKLENINILFSDDPKFAFAKLTNFFRKELDESNLIETNNLPFFGKKVSIGKNCKFGKNIVICDNVIIGNNVEIGHNVVIYNNVKIGNNVAIGSGTIIGSDGFGNVFHNNKWFHISHLGGVTIHNDVSIGSNCTIDRGTIDNTTINSGVIIDNLVHIAHNVNIGEKTAIAAKVGIAGSCLIGKRNMIGGMVGIVDHIKTADDVVISATSTVNKNIKEPGVYTGIMPISKHALWKRIALWITKLDKIVRLINFKKK